MSEQPEIPRFDDCGADAAAYVLGALEPVEAERFAQHLSGCAVCRMEVARLQQAADVLPALAPQHAAPDDLTARVMARVRGESDAVRGAAASRSKRPRWTLRTAWAAGTVSALAAAAIIAVLLVSLSSPGATRVYRAAVGDAKVLITDDRGQLLVRSLPQPADGHIYEVWLERGGGSPQPTQALFSVTADGSGDVDVPGDMRGVTAVLVTEEPAGGTTVPTSTPVIVTHIA